MTGSGATTAGSPPEDPAGQRFQLALDLHRSGRLAEAEAIYRDVIRMVPEHANAHHFLGACRQQQGDLAGAIAAIQRSIAIDPQNAMFRHNLGNCLALAGRALEAVLEQRRATDLRADYAEAWKGLGDALRLSGQYAASIDPYRRALSLRSAYPDAHNNLGISLLEMNQPNLAEPEFRAALDLAPAYAEAVHNLALAMAKQGQFLQAEELYRRAIQLKADYASAWRGIANVCRLTGRNEESIGHFRTAIAADPADMDATSELGAVLMVTGRFNESVDEFGKVYDRNSDNVVAVNNLSTALIACQRLAEAEMVLAGAIARNPEALDLYTNLTFVYALNGQITVVEKLCRDAIALDPGRPSIWNNLGAALFEKGDIAGCLASVKRALEIDPQHSDANVNYLYFLSRSVSATPEEVYDAHVKWRATQCKSIVALPKAKPAPLLRANGEKRRLRIGYVSGDFRNHSVSYFIEPIIRHHDRSKVEVFCYSNCTTPDDTTVRISRIADGWRPIWGLTDLEVAQMIRADGIDVLVDLAGFTQANRIKVFVYRAAPVQVTYLGYFTTTGIHEIDYWITDRVLHPEDSVERTVEKKWHLDRCWVSYQPNREAPDVRPGPLSRGEPLTFGSFNATSKLTPKTLALWGRVLRALPETRLLLKYKNLIDGPERERVVGLLGREGIAMERVELRYFKDTARDHFNAYGDMDMSLDTAPLTGGTTTADALWMGVPVVTLAGRVMIERMSASMLQSVGLEDWIARTEDEFVEKAIRFASDPAALIAMRPGRRAAAASAPLFDAAGLARTLDESFARMYQTWLDRV